MGTLILHAGLPKTGTSCLQIALHAGRDQSATAGMLRPETVVSLPRVLYHRIAHLG